LRSQEVLLVVMDIRRRGIMRYGILVVVLKGWVLERMMCWVVLEASVGV
jgi:hypothetical protein